MPFPGWISYARNSIKLAPSLAGTYSEFAANAPARTDKGFWVEDARTNQSTNENRDATGFAGMTLGGDAAATLTIVPDATELAAAGLSGVVTDVFKLDNSAGTTSANVRVTAALNNAGPVTISAWWRGTGTGRLHLFGYSTGNVAVPAAYERLINRQTGDGGGDDWFVNATNGAVIYFVLNGIEHAAFESSPIPTAGAAATRPADVATVTLGAWFDTAAGSYHCKGRTAPASAVQIVWQMDDGTTNNRLTLKRNATNEMRFEVVAGGVAQADLLLGVVADDTDFECAMSWKLNDINAILLGGVNQNDAAATIPAGLTTLRLGHDTAGNHLNGWKAFDYYYPTKEGAAYIAALFI